MFFVRLQYQIGKYVFKSISAALMCAGNEEQAEANLFRSFLKIAAADTPLFQIKIKLWHIVRDKMATTIVVFSHSEEKTNRRGICVKSR